MTDFRGTFTNNLYCSTRFSFLFAFLVLFCDFVGFDSQAASPALYRKAAYESPVRGAPDDLLLVAGYGFADGDVVVYQAITDTTSSPIQPRRLPTRSTADAGLATIVSKADVPYSLTIKLPQSLRAAQAYALWVRTAAGAWSKPIKINDARPLWFSPVYVYASHTPGGLPRELKIIGRNLQPSPLHSTQVRLIGPQQVTVKALAGERSSAVLNEYVARVPLPSALVPGRYRIELSRDDTSWVGVPDQALEILPDPLPAREFRVGDPQFGGCRPNDGADDTSCVVRAIAAARQAGGGTVFFEAGTWDLIDEKRAGDREEGIVVPRGISLRGAGSDATRIVRHGEWSAHAAEPAFSVMGNAVISGFTFGDLKVYEAKERAGPFIQLGEFADRVRADPESPPGIPVVENVVITGNVFDKTMVGIGTGGLPVNRLFVTYNTFGAFSAALELVGNRFNMSNEYRLDDTVIAHNVFKPGSELDLSDKTGTLASEVGAGHRVDFSENTADGASTDYLYSPTDAKGWRAAFFWNMDNDVEEVLVSQNTATCTGDKIGDGEAIAFDINANTFAFQAAPSVVSASAGTVAVSEPPIARQNNRDVPSASYYLDHWVQVVSGPGLGQARRIVGYRIDAVNHLTTFRVAPEWDVIPSPGRTRIAVGREFWQLYVIDNRIDNRRPLCQKSNRSRLAAGAIVMWAPSADSAVAGNRQYDSDGILVQQAYLVPEHPCPDCAMQSSFQSALEIRENVIDGEYDWATDCSSSGISLGIAAAPWEAQAPPSVGFGVAVSHNLIRHADGLRSGAIAQVSTWYSGPAPGRWPLSDNATIDHNSIVDVAGGRAMAICTKGYARVGIAFPDDAVAWRTVLYANSCRNVTQPIGVGGVDTVKVCPSSAEDSCECPAPASATALRGGLR